jgi:general secretion pathway protein J
MTNFNMGSGNIVLLIKKNKNGFTLIEVLLAVFIFAVVISLIFTAYTGSIRIMNNTDSQADVSRMASIALERMTEDLESILISTWIKPDDTANSPGLSGRFFGENDQIDGMSADRIRFLSKARVIFDEQPHPNKGPGDWKSVGGLNHSRLLT